MTDGLSDPDSSLPDVCVVTHPLGAAGENATRTLLEILAAITSVSLVTVDLPVDSIIRERHEVVELSQKEADQSNVVVAAFRFLLNQVRMCRAITRREEKVVLFFGATAYLLPIAWARISGKTVVLEPRGDVPLTLRLDWERLFPDPVARFLARLVWGLERLAYRLADAIVTYTPAMADELSLREFEDKLHPHGARYVNTDQFAPNVPFEKRDRIVGYLGRIDEEKGIRTLATVIACLPEDVTFRFVGDGDLLPWLRDKLAKEIDLGRVELTGWVAHDTVPEELNRLRLLVMPSLPTEGLPTTLLEAMACGTPVYSTPVSGVPDVVQGGETGFLMDNTDSGAIAAEIEMILDREDLPQVSENARELCKAEYSFGAAVRRYRSILDAIQ